MLGVHCSIENLRLWNVPRKSVQKRASRGIWLSQPFEHHRLHQHIGNEVAAVHRRLCSSAEIRSTLAVRTQQVTAGNVGDPEALGELNTLGALTRSRSTKQQDEFARAHAVSMDGAKR